MTSAKTPKRVKVRGLGLAGKTLNVPHTEHREADADANEKNAITFDEDGFAKVSPTLADGLVEFYPKLVEKV